MALHKIKLKSNSVLFKVNLLKKYNFFRSKNSKTKLSQILFNTNFSIQSFTINIMNRINRYF